MGVEPLKVQLGSHKPELRFFGLLKWFAHMPKLKPMIKSGNKYQHFVILGRQTCETVESPIWETLERFLQRINYKGEVFLSLNVTLRMLLSCRSTTDLKQKRPESCQRPRESLLPATFAFFPSNKSVTTKPARLTEERCYFTSALPRSGALTQPQLLPVRAAGAATVKTEPFQTNHSFLSGI